MQIKKKSIVILGGGAAGFFASLSCAEKCQVLGIEVNIIILEAQKNFLRKVRISGGGRCNVTHFEYSPPTFCESYPRGKRELRAPFSQFQAKDTVEWFAKRGLELVREEDGRMFPKSNTSQSVIDCFQRESTRLGIEKISGEKIIKLRKDEVGFVLESKSGQTYNADAILIATGSDLMGYELASSLGHTITDLAPSLFTFKVSHPLLRDMAGTSFTSLSIKTTFPDKKKFSYRGAALITHHGLSGPVILKLSAWAAREMKKCSYRCQLQVNWSPHDKEAVVLEELLLFKKKEQGAMVKNRYPSYVSKKFWQRILDLHEIADDKKWNELSDKSLRRLVAALYSFPLDMTGQNRFKEEFVECGGVKLKEVSFKTMESKVVPKLFFAGEVLDVDGVTGGYNFQNAWTTGHIAGLNLALSCLE